MKVGEWRRSMFRRKKTVRDRRRLSLARKKNGIEREDRRSRLRRERVELGRR